MIDPFDMFSGFSYWILAVFSAYFAILIGIAVFRSRQMQAMSDYVLGSRRVGAFTSALSASSSAASGWTILVFPALAFSQGTIHLWTVLGVVSGLWFSWTIIAKRLRRYTIAAEDALTVPEFLEKRFGDKTGTLRTLAGLITIFFVIFYISSGLIAGAKLLETVFGLGYGMGILTTLIAVASYTFIGGFLAVSKTDVFQAMIMLTGIIVLPLTLIFATDAPFRETGAAPPGFWNPLIQAKGDTIGPFFLLSAAGWGLGYLGSQRVVQRFMAVESEAKIPASRNIGVAWLILIDLFAILTGLVALAALAEVEMLAEVMQDPELLYLVASEVFFHPVVSGLLLTAVVAAVMSTADSQLLLASAIATDDLPIIKKYAYAIKNAGPGLVGPLPARGGGRHSLRSFHHPPGIGIQSGFLRLGRDGGSLRPGHDYGVVLAPVQSLGRACVNNHRYGGGLYLGVYAGRPLGTMGHSARHSRLPDSRSRGRRRDSNHARTIGRGSAVV